MLILRRFHMRKSCCSVIATSQAAIAAQTLTLMQGFEETECNPILHSHIHSQHESPLKARHA